MWRIRRPVGLHLSSLTNSLYFSRAHTFSDTRGLSPLFNNKKPQFGSSGFDIELVDNETWQVSSGLAHTWKTLNGDVGVNSADASVQSDNGCSDDDDDEIDNMRIRGNLFYKLDRDSKEFEEYSLDFHRRNKQSSNTKANNKNSSDVKDDNRSESKRKETLGRNLGIEVEHSQKFVSNGKVFAFVGNNNVGGLNGHGNKKLRTPTFNQLTGPYHEPFCLDIYISKASVRACIIHRVTSKVVAGAHSISKDMKFDLASTRNAASCAAVGSILAQRALADDIHDVVYTPRKGERLEGKFQIVLQSIIDNGVNVKLKFKQRNPNKTGALSSVVS